MLQSNRAGNTYLEFNQDWHLRDSTMMFIIQTESNGNCTAKPLNFDKDGDKMPVVTLKNASKELRKDVWVMEGNVDNDTEVTVNTICKSSTDDFLQCETLNVSDYDPQDPSTIKTLKQKGSKIRS